MKKTRAKYIGPDDVEYKNGNEYMVYPIEEVPDGSLIAAENSYGEAYAVPACLFELKTVEKIAPGASSKRIHMDKQFDMVSFLKDLRSGKPVECPFCKEGHFVPVGDPKTTHGFYCSSCKERVNID